MMEIPQALTGSVIRRGTILHSDIFEDIDHGKFFVIIGVDGDDIAGFFFINSNIHRSIMGKPEQLAMQYQLRHKDYNFLRYDSFLCATNVVVRSKSELTESITAGRTTIKGELRKRHLEDVLGMVRDSRLFSKVEKRRFFY